MSHAAARLLAFALPALLPALAAPAPAAAAPPADGPPPSARIPGCTAEAARARQPLPHGCATARNLEAMIADPADLAGARALAPADADTSIAPVRRLRLGTTPEPAGRRTTEPGP